MRRNNSIAAILVVLPLAVGCSASKTPSPNQDTSVSTAGSRTGGSTTDTGGVSASGGRSAGSSTGGAANGGSTTTGGAVLAGGTLASGGVTAVGGFPASGGVSGQDAGSRDGNAAAGGIVSNDGGGSAGTGGGLAIGGSGASAAIDGGVDRRDSAESGETSSPTVGCPKGMVRISAKNQTFTMGLDKSNAPLQGNGQPWSCYLGVHQVTFTYDFCMDAYLVTQSQFLAVMGFNPSKHQIAGATGGTLPVDSATWFDAMIYCNTRSQADGLAPAYSYGAVTHSGTGSLYGGGPPTTTDPKSASNVAGVVMDLTKPGYRLPTNAEYEYAERANTTGNYFFAPDGANVSQVAQQYGWGPDNSGGTTHPVGLLKPNPWGLYDIVGNLFEWENDWDAPYPTTPQVDPVGEPAGASCGGATPAGGAKMAKGGSFKADVGNHQRIGYHYYWTPASVNGELGLRCVATVVP